MYEREVLDFNNAIASSSQQMQCLEESKAMVRDTSVRLEKAFVDLEELVESASKEENRGEGGVREREGDGGGSQTEFDLTFGTLLSSV